MRLSLIALAIALLGASPADGAVLAVPGDHPSVQAALEAAEDGDEIRVAPGTYVEHVDFLGKAVTVGGSGPETVLQGTGKGSVVTFASGEGPDSILDSVTVTGGSAPMGGGILIMGASPTIRRSVIADNAASSRGSGIYVGGAAAAPHIHNNLVMYNVHTAGDPHAIQSNGASPRLVNNTVVRNDSNGMFLTGGGIAEVVNNILAFNGSRPRGEGKRGRGICDFNEGSIIRYNLFHRNRVAALLYAGKDFRRIKRAERRLSERQLTDNRDGNPRFVRRRLPKDGTRVTPADFSLKPRARRAIGAGDSDAVFNDADGTRNTLGHTGGPYGVRF